MIYQTFEMGAEMAAAEVVCCDAAGEELSRQSVTPEDSDATICFDAGGQILANKILRFDWDQ